MSMSNISELKPIYLNTQFYSAQESFATTNPCLSRWLHDYTFSLGMQELASEHYRDPGFGMNAVEKMLYRSCKALIPYAQNIFSHYIWG